MCVIKKEFAYMLNNGLMNAIYLMQFFYEKNLVGFYLIMSRRTI